MTPDRPYTERMSRILADAKPAPPRVGCVLLRCRLGARGRDGSNAPLGELERLSLFEELNVIAGGVAPDTLAPEVFFIDPGSKTEQYGGSDAWARCVKGYLNARGYAASVAVAPDREAALAAARSRWGVVVVHEGAPQARAAGELSEVREITRVGLRSPAPGQAPSGRAKAPQKQLGLPGLVLGRPKRKPRKAPSALPPSRAGAA